MKHSNIFIVIASILILFTIIGLTISVYNIPKTANEVFEYDLLLETIQEIKIEKYSNRTETIIYNNKIALLLPPIRNGIYYQRPTLVDIFRNGNFSYCITIIYLSGQQESFNVYANGYAINLNGKKYITNNMLNDAIAYCFN